MPPFRAGLLPRPAVTQCVISGRTCPPYHFIAKLGAINYETTIADLMAGQHSDPLRVVKFNTDIDRAEDVSPAIAQEILRRLDLEGRNVPSELEGFIDRHVGRDRQLTLRLA